MLDVLIAIVAAAVLVYAAITGFSTFAAVTQMGSIQERSMPWASVTKPIKAVVGKTVGVSASIVSKSTDAVVKSTDAVVSTAAHAVNPTCAEDVKTKDKLIYTAGVVNVCLTAYIFGAFPTYFYLWHTPKAILYTMHRWYTFKKQNQHYLLYDFCYWANLLSLIYCWITPNNPIIFQILYMVSHGPLAWSILAFSQSLIFHSAPHMTSVFIHTSPMLLCFGLRWKNQPDSGFTVCDGDCNEDISRLSLIFNASAYFYLPWVVLYYLWVFVFLNKRVKERGYKTLFDRVANKGPTKWLTKISKNEYVQKAAYMMVHVAFGLSTMLLATSYWHSMAANWIFVFGVITTSAWNAGGFYFNVFAQQYAADLEEKMRKP